MMFIFLLCSLKMNKGVKMNKHKILFFICSKFQFVQEFLNKLIFLNIL